MERICSIYYLFILRELAQFCCFVLEVIVNYQHALHKVRSR